MNKEQNPERSVATKMLIEMKLVKKYFTVFRSISLFECILRCVCPFFDFISALESREEAIQRTLIGAIFLALHWFLLAA